MTATTARTADAPLRLLTVDDIAAKLAISTEAVRAMRKRGQLPGAIKVGGRLRFREDLVDEWLASLPVETGLDR